MQTLKLHSDPLKEMPKRTATEPYRSQRTKQMHSALMRRQPLLEHGHRHMVDEIKHPPYDNKYDAANYERTRHPRHHLFYRLVFIGLDPVSVPRQYPLCGSHAVAKTITY
jgi:hypothetical protein